MLLVLITGVAIVQCYTQSSTGCKIIERIQNIKVVCIRIIFQFFTSHTFLFSKYPQTLYSPINGVGLCLGRIFNIRLIQKILNSKKDLLDSNCWAPVLLLIQQRQTHRTCSHWNKDSFPRLSYLFLPQFALAVR